MIKLNNKNITYVALADSSNSIKAPKEIWYADSNNSVKLVYRRKDALIEGEDYEKYHWLEGRNGAYINTEHLVKTYEDAFEVYAKYDGTNRNPDGGEQNPFGIQDDNIRLAAYINGGNNINAVIKQNESTGNHDIQIHKDVFQITLYAPNSSEYVKTLDGVSYTNPIGGTVVNDANLNMYVFARNGKVNSYFQGDISYFRITDLTFTTDKLHFIPCKLLKPVPKWLDANGIRRQVGECGMIDLVSGKFYGNVNSNGTFTVENYYERKEWLQGDGSAYIEGINYNLWTNRVELKVGKINVTTIQNNELHYKQTTGDGNVWAVQQNPTLTTKLICIFRESGTAVHIVHVDSMPSQVTLSFYQNGGYAYCLYDDTEYKGGTLNQSSWDTDITPNIFSYKMSYIREVLPDGSYRSNLIPCTLTMDLPASMDANNIARTKGTSGMWDLVSDRFYGNVANSGTFKAVNLAEGVDYEVHQWLRAEVDTRAGMASLPVKSTNLYFKRKTIRGSNHHYFSTNDYEYYCESPSLGYHLSIWKYSEGTVIYRNSDIVSDEVIIDCSSDKIYVNGYEIPIYGYPISYVQFRAMSVNGMEILTSSVTVDGIERYIPVKLLHSIPSKYDANGIARQAGECGMYDTVNDVFYGNVASSGTFSVSDDS